ncbi:MAG: hypothetical protein CM1200mP10_13250 [Candidatus Neomarinimicrobiota bacterium]|nr:MAG: hypothetical protein CM1200mP10_13250 [Candidatus Neomarinimicrobiota bacterium]
MKKGIFSFTLYLAAKGRAFYALLSKYGQNGKIQLFFLDLAVQENNIVTDPDRRLIGR